MEFLRFFRVLRRRWRLIAALSVLGVVAGYVSATVAEEADPLPVEITRYSATHTLVVDENLPQEVRTLDIRNLAQVAQRVTHGDVPATVALLLGRDEADVATRLHVLVDSNAQVMEITAVAETADGAVELSDELADELIRFLEREASELFAAEVTALESRLATAEQDLTDVRAELAAARAAGDEGQVALLTERETLYESQRGRAEVELVSHRAEGEPIVPIETLETAGATEISDNDYEAARRAALAGDNIDLGTAAESGARSSGSRRSGLPIPDSPGARAVLGGIVGALMAVGFILVLDRLDPRLRTKEDIELAIDIPVIAEIPPLSRRQQRETDVLAFSAPRSRAAEAYRVLRSAIDYADSANPGRAGAHVVLVTSPGPSEGKTTSVANLAVVLAEADKDVLVVNCDFRRPRLTDYLGGEDRAQHVNLTSVPGVHLITHVLPEDSNPTPADVLAAQRRVIERARERFDVVLLDTAPLLTTNDATDVLESADQVVMVFGAGRTTRESADRAIELLERRGASILGAVLIGARDVPNAREYYYEGDDSYLVKPRGRRRSSSRRAATPTEPPAPIVPLPPPEPVPAPMPRPAPTPPPAPMPPAAAPAPAVRPSRPPVRPPLPAAPPGVGSSGRSLSLQSRLPSRPAD